MAKFLGNEAIKELRNSISNWLDADRWLLNPAKKVLNDTLRHFGYEKILPAKPRLNLHYYGMFVSPIAYAGEATAIVALLGRRSNDPDQPDVTIRLTLDEAAVAAQMPKARKRLFRGHRVSSEILSEIIGDIGTEQVMCELEQRLPNLPSLPILHVPAVSHLDEAAQALTFRGREVDVEETNEKDFVVQDSVSQEIVNFFHFKDIITAAVDHGSGPALEIVPRFANETPDGLSHKQLVFPKEDLLCVMRAELEARKNKEVTLFPSEELRAAYMTRAAALEAINNEEFSLRDLPRWPETISKSVLGAPK